MRGASVAADNVVRRFVWSALGVLVCWLVVACDNGAAPIERTRATSPTGDLDAVFLEWPGGATVGFVYGLAVVHRGAAAVPDQVLLKGSSLIADSMRWEDAGTVSIQYSRGGEIYSFRSRWFPQNTLAGRTQRFVDIQISRR